MANLGQTRTTSFLLWIAGIVGAVLVVFAIRSLLHEKVMVRTTSVTYQSLISTVPTTGKVEPVSEYQAHAPGPGVIQKIYVEVGQHVTPGTLLLRLTDADAHARVASAENQLAGAELNSKIIGAGGSIEERQHFQQDLVNAQIEQRSAQTNLDTLKKLQQEGAASAAEILNAEQRLQNANISVQNAESRRTSRYDESDLSAAKARLTEAQANLAAAHGAVNAVDIRSPLAGTVYSIPFSTYDFVPSGGEDLLDIADLTKLQIHAYFDEPEIGKLAKGQAVKIEWAAKPNKFWHGRISQPPSTVSAYGARSVGEAIITVDDATGDLLPNVNVTVTVTNSELLNVLTIPREALHTEGANNYVYRIIDGHLAQTPIRIGATNLTRVQILSGLAKDEVVVLGPASSSQELSNGLQVTRVP
jgi:HlyD family secretion protein